MGCIAAGMGVGWAPLTSARLIADAGSASMSLFFVRRFLADFAAFAGARVAAVFLAELFAADLGAVFFGVAPTLLFAGAFACMCLCLSATAMLSASQRFLAGAAGRLLCHFAESSSPAISSRVRRVSTE